MPTYNPNSIWGSKKKEYVYTGKGPQPGSLTGPGARDAAEPQPHHDAEADVTPSLTPPKKGGVFRGHGLAWFGVGLVAILIAAGIVIIVKNRPAPQLTISFEQPAQVLVGDPFVVTVSFSNNSNQALKNAQLSVLLPDGISFLDEPQSQRVLQRSVGDIASGGTGSQPFNLIETGAPNSVQHLSATMIYGSASNATAQFQSNSQASLVVGDYALKFNFQNAPQSVFSGQNFTVTVNYNNQSPDAIANAQFSLDYAPAFSLISSSIPFSAVGGSGLWDLGTVSAAASSVSCTPCISSASRIPRSTSSTLARRLASNSTGSVTN